MAVNDQINRITDVLFEVLPLVHRKLMRFEPAGEHGISPPQLAVLRMLHQTGPVPISEVARRLMIARPHMTAFISRLIGQALAERFSDKKDRRVTNVRLTARGEQVLRENRERLKENVRDKLSGLNARDLDLMAASLENLQEIGTRIRES